MTSNLTENHAVFLNIPYDDSFTALYLAYIVAVSSLGLIPHATVALPGDRRLDRIAQLIERCSFSLHDLSRVELDTNPPPTPRFNMPFELGFTVAWARSNPTHRWFVFESNPRRTEKSLSDLAGTDVYVHGGSVEGVMREVRSAFISSVRQPSVPEMMRVYTILNSSLPAIQQHTAAKSFFSAVAFSEVAYTAALLVRKYIFGYSLGDIA